MPSKEAWLGFACAVAAIAVLILLGVNGGVAISWVMGVALVGWAVFAIRDAIRGIRRRRAANVTGD